jgi:hypothetical protein
MKLAKISIEGAAYGWSDENGDVILKNGVLILVLEENLHDLLEENLHDGLFENLTKETTMKWKGFSKIFDPSSNDVLNVFHRHIDFMMES